MPATEVTQSPAVPRYLSGDGAGIKEFLDKFDVSSTCDVSMRLKKCTDG